MEENFIGWFQMYMCISKKILANFAIATKFGKLISKETYCLVGWQQRVYSVGETGDINKRL